MKVKYLILIIDVFTSNTLSGQKARVLLMLAMSKTKNVSEIKRIFDEY